MEGEFFRYYHEKNPIGYIIKNINKFSSLKDVANILKEDEKSRLEDDLSYSGIEEFGQSERGVPFQTEIEAKNYIDNYINNIDFLDFYIEDFRSLISILENIGELQPFVREFYEFVIFPAWYNYWSYQGIDETRENVQDVYNLLVGSKTPEDNHMAILRAIQTSHQTGDMLDYLEEYGGEEDIYPDKIKDLMTELTNGSMNSIWDKQLKEIGVIIPKSVKRNNVKQMV